MSVTGSAIQTLVQDGVSVDLVENVFPQDPLDLWNAEFYAGVGYKLKDVLENSPDILDPAVREMLDGPFYNQSIEEYFGRVFARYEFRERFRQTMEPYDLLVTPTLPVSELDAGVNVPNGYPDRNAVSWVYYTYPFNLTGNPALSVPCGTTASGLPVGLQVIAKAHREVDALRLAAHLEDLLPWQKIAVPLVGIGR